MPGVYLAGPITGLTYDDGQDWRSYARAVLATQGIEAFSPLRGKDYLKEYGELDAGGVGSAYTGLHALSDPAGIVTRDRLDCTKRDLVLVNLLGADRVSVGTCIEFGWADAARVPIVVAMERDGSNPHDHAMVYGLAGYVLPSLDDAIQVATVILKP